MDLLGVKNLWVFRQMIQLPTQKWELSLNHLLTEITYHVQSISSPKKKPLLSFITSLLLNFSIPSWYSDPTCLTAAAT